MFHLYIVVKEGKCLRGSSGPTSSQGRNLCTSEQTQWRDSFLLCETSHGIVRYYIVRK